MKKVFISLGIAFVSFLAVVDYMQFDYKLKHQHEISTGNNA